MDPFIFKNETLCYISLAWHFRKQGNAAAWVLVICKKNVTSDHCNQSLNLSSSGGFLKVSAERMQRDSCWPLETRTDPL